MFLYDQTGDCECPNMPLISPVISNGELACMILFPCGWQDETMKVIDECNGHWKALVDGKTEAGKMWIK